MKNVKTTTKAPENKVALSESLAVKYRPRRVPQLVGQPHIVSQLKGMYKSKKFPVAFLIEGQYGGGKTTVARLIHGMLNCEKGTICGECSSCSMGVEHHPDLINVNAGKDGKVDDIRRLIKSAEVSPLFNKKVVVIDECLVGETRVLLDYSGATATIKEICENPEKYTHVVSFNHETLQNEITPITSRFVLEKDSGCLLDIEFDNGFKLEGITDNHPIWSVTKNDYIRAGDLLDGDEVLPFRP